MLAARSLGAGTRTVYRRVILPATLPSIATGSVVGMGITWEVVVAAELISGGSQGGDGGGLGSLLWNAYRGGAIAQVVVCMISLGLAGLLSSVAVWFLSDRPMPWRQAGMSTVVGTLRRPEPLLPRPTRASSSTASRCGSATAPWSRTAPSR